MFNNLGTRNKEPGETDMVQGFKLREKKQELED
jgi:hypothetical protein